MNNIDFSLGMRRAVRQFQHLSSQDDLSADSGTVLREILDLLPSNPRISDLCQVIARLNDIGCPDAAPVLVQALLIRAQQ